MSRRRGMIQLLLLLLLTMRWQHHPSLSVSGFVVVVPSSREAGVSSSVTRCRHSRSRSSRSPIRRAIKRDAITKRTGSSSLMSSMSLLLAARTLLSSVPAGGNETTTTHVVSSSGRRRPLRRKLLSTTVTAATVVGLLLSRPFSSAAQAATASAATTSSNLPVALGWKNLVLAASLVVASAGVGLTLVSGLPKLGLAILKACIRSTVQLYLVTGYVLTHVLLSTNTGPGVVGTWILATAVLAAWESSSRVEYTYPKLRKHLVLSLLLGGGSVLGTTAALQILGVQFPWYAPRTWIPIGGMVFGNSLTAVALAAQMLTSQLVNGRKDIEYRLCHGATWKEAIRNAQDAIYTTSLTPVLNFLSIAGIVHIPGNMAGQLLAGQAPFQAAAYQLVIFFLIASTVCSTVQILTYLGLRELIDQPEHTLRPHLLQKRVLSSASSEGHRLSKARRLVSRLPSLVANRIVRQKPSTEASDLDEPLMHAINGESTTNKTPPIQKLQSERTEEDASMSPVVFSVTNMRVPRAHADLSLELRYDDRIALTGRSGIGKSQVLRTLAGIEPIDKECKARQPQLQLIDIPASSLSRAEWRSHVLLVPQDRPTLEGTPNDFYNQLCQFASQKVKLSDSKNVIAGHSCTPVEYGVEWGLSEDIFDQPWSTLSGGEAQRAVLAMALSTQPDVLLLDECFSALDEPTSQKVEATLRKLRIPILMVSHSSTQVERFCNQQLSLERDATNFRSAVESGKAGRSFPTE